MDISLLKSPLPSSKSKPNVHLFSKPHSFLCVYSKILTIGEDSVLNVYRILVEGDSNTNQQDGNKSLSENSIHKVDLESEFYAIASNSMDRIAIGGE